MTERPVGATADNPLPASQTDNAAALTRLVAGCAQLGIVLSPVQERQFADYFDELVTWNEKLNLTAITGFEDVQIKHFLDSVVSLPILAEESGGTQALEKPQRLVDVGAGAGFPGIPLKIVAPALALTLMDGTQKKIAFLQAVIARLGLERAHVVHGRAEELGRLPEHRGHYDLVTARAVAPLNTLVEYLLPLARIGGLVVIYKGPGAPQEFMAARQAIKVLGGEPVRLAPVEVPFLGEHRFILLLRKVHATPNQYPRSQGLPRKRPL